MRWAERLVGLAEEQGAPLRRALARRTLGSTLFDLGRPTDALAALDEGIAIDDAITGWENRRADILLYTERAGVMCRMYSGRALWFLGFPERALERVEAGLALGQRLAHVHSLTFALHFAAALHSLRREFAKARTRAEAAIDLASAHHLPLLLANGTMDRGFALVSLGQQTEGIAELRAGLAAWNAVGAHLLDSQWLGFIAEAHHQAGQLDDALNALDRAAETGRATGECHYQAELYRLRGSSWPRRRTLPNGIVAPAGDRHGPSQQAKSWSCARQLASRGYGANRASAPRLATCSRRFPAGSPRARYRRSQGRQRPARRARLTRPGQHRYPGQRHRDPGCRDPPVKAELAP